MGYKNANNIIPASLLEEIQEYVDGEYIYIPRKAENKQCWGAATDSRQYLRERNERIFVQYQDGISVEKIAQNNFLSTKTIYKILSSMKNEN